MACRGVRLSVSFALRVSQSTPRAMQSAAAHRILRWALFLAAEERGRTQKIACVREFSVFSHRKVPPLGRMLLLSRGNQWCAGVFGSAGAWGGTTEERGRIAVGRRLVKRCVGFQRWGSEARAVGCGVGGTTEGMKVEENCVGRGEGWGGRVGGCF